MTETINTQTENNEDIDYFKTLSDKLVTTQSKREKLIDKLDAVIDKMSINFEDKFTTNQGKLGVIAAFKDILNDIDKQNLDLEKLKLNKKEKDNESKYSDIVVKYMYKLGTEEESSTPAPIVTDADIDTVFSQTGDEIFNGEIE